MSTENKERGCIISMTLCGKCLHDVNCHSEHNAHFYFCSACQKLCDKDAFVIQHSPSDLPTIMRIGALKQ